MANRKPYKPVWVGKVYEYHPLTQEQRSAIQKAAWVRRKHIAERMKEMNTLLKLFDGGSVLKGNFPQGKYAFYPHPHNALNFFYETFEELDKHVSQSLQRLSEAGGP